MGQNHLQRRKERGISGGLIIEMKKINLALTFLATKDQREIFHCLKNFRHTLVYLVMKMLS